MCTKKNCISFIFICFLVVGSVFAQDRKDSVSIHFKQGYSTLDLSIRNNRESLKRMTDSLNSETADPAYRLRSVRIIGGASPEGSVLLNRRLSEKRAKVLFDYLSQYGALPESSKGFSFVGRDWNGLLQLVKLDSDVPHQQEVIAFLQEIITDSKGVKGDTDAAVGRLARFKNGEPYRYMYKVLFPELRAARLLLGYDRVWKPLPSLPGLPLDFPLVKDRLPFVAPAPMAADNFYMAIRTNLLYDALLVPNIGVEFTLGNRWTIGGNWMYAWWHNDRKHDYWRIYGGDLYVRKYFGRKAMEKPLQGHHIGLYAQILTYDFELGGKGYMGGIPGGTLWDKFNYGGGIEYGYSLPIARRLNLDFSIGIGYLGGEYHEYIPDDDCYVWQATKNRNYWGPTKAEVSLVWLIGKGNVNKKKGGKR